MIRFLAKTSFLFNFLVIIQFFIVLLYRLMVKLEFIFKGLRVSVGLSFSPSRGVQEAAARTRKNVFLQRKSSF